MSWCPKCKMEYREGITLCSDCDVALVETLQEADNQVPFFQAEQEKVAEKLVSYFDYSGLKATIQFDDENQMYVVYVPEDQVKNAKKLYQAFYFVEREKSDTVTDETSEELPPSSTLEDSANETYDDIISDEISTMDKTASSEEDTVEAEIESGNNSTYVMKEDQYKDLNSTVWIFSLFGIGGIIFVFLNIVGILQILNGILPNLVMGALFLFFIYTGLSSYHKAEKVKTEIDIENKLTKDINQWLEQNVTESFLTSIHDPSVSDELNYLQKITKIKKMLMEEFGKQNPSYLDRLIEEYYSNTFDS